MALWSTDARDDATLSESLMAPVVQAISGTEAGYKPRWEAIGLGVLYILLSVGFFVAHSVDILRGAVQRAWDFLWLFGPPANLIYETNYLWAYLVGTVVCGMLGWTSLRATRPDLRLVLGALTIIMWCLFGFLAYAPTV